MRAWGMAAEAVVEPDGMVTRMVRVVLLLLLPLMVGGGWLQRCLRRVTLVALGGRSCYWRTIFPCQDPHHTYLHNTAQHSTTLTP